MSLTTATAIATATQSQTQPVTRPEFAIPRWAVFLLVFGVFLSLRGYHSFDGDQAYRLPLLLHRQDPSLFADDPFVKAIDHFNPHRGYLTLLDWSSRPFGLATGILGLFLLTLIATSLGVDRLSRSVWPGLGGKVGLTALVLVLMAKGGNIGTNHLFESTLLDRLMGFGLGWLALASAVGYPKRGIVLGPLTLGLAALVHPSVGLQLAITLAGAWLVWGIGSRWTEVSRSRAVLAIIGLGLAMAPALILFGGQGGLLFQGLPTEEFRLLAVRVQGPQHMLPSTWRMPQWLAWGCYPIMATLALSGREVSWPTARIRFAGQLGVNLASLALAYLAVEVWEDLRITIFQPFRMATLARGLCLVAVSGRLVKLWEQGDLFSRGRVVLIGLGLAGDWSLVVATAVDLAMEVGERAGMTLKVRRVVGLVVLALGLVQLARHDTESGHWGFLAGLGTLIVLTLLVRRSRWEWSARRLQIAIGLAWAVPLGSLGIGLTVQDPGGSKWMVGLVERCRFAEVPTDDLERLAVWVRDQTPISSRFIGPPGPKTFRLWSRRAVAFNRASSPYHAEGLADWAGRFRDHVGFRGSTADFARAYLVDRHRLEAAFGQMTDTELASLARAQGADHILTSSSRVDSGPRSPLQKLRVEGRYAVYQVRSKP